MNDVKSKKLIALILMTILVLISITILELTKVKEKDENYDIKIAAAKSMEDASDAILKRKQELNIEIDEADFNLTGFIGEPYSSITTTLGSIEAKRTSANPDMAAMVVDMLCEAKIKKGDQIAVNFSSSFPALNIAVLSACHAMEVEPIVINSVGASTYGANNEDFIYLEMEKLLYDMGIISSKSVAASIGGGNDVGEEMSPATLEKIKGKIKNLDIIFIDESDYQKNLSKRLSIYDSFGKCKCLVNVGGNLISEGKNESMINMPGGVQTRKAVTLNSKSGLIEVFLSQGLPVIHLLNIKSLALKYGIPVDPIGFGNIGEGEIYYKYKYNMPLALLSLIAIIAVLIIYKKGFVPHEKTAK